MTALSTMERQADSGGAHAARPGCRCRAESADGAKLT